MTEGTAPENSKRGSGCLRGCGGCLGLIAASLLIVIAAFMILRARRPNPKELFSGASDPVAEAAIENVLTRAGVHGAQVTVIPIKGSDKQLAFIVLNEASGFSMGSLAQGGDQGLASALLGIDAANRSQNLNIGSVAMEYRDESGEPLFVVATDQDKMSAFAAGEISKEELLLGTDIGLSNLLGGIGALSDAAGQ